MVWLKIALTLFMLLALTGLVWTYYVEWKTHWRQVEDE
jgi:hypothetical protein